MKARKIIKNIRSMVTHQYTIKLMTVASLAAMVTFNRCFIFLGEGNMEDDVNAESIKQLRMYTSEIKKSK